MDDPFQAHRQRPFPDTADPDVFYPSPIHQGAFADLFAALKTPERLIVFVGEPGTGKTTILRRASRDLEGIGVRVLSCNVAETPEEMLTALCRQLGTAEPPTAPERREAFMAALSAETRAGRSVVVALDEAQLLDRASLGSLLALAAAATAAGSRLAILLVGQPELLLRLDEPVEATVGASGVVRVTLPRLPASEVGPYVAFRLRQAGAPRPDVFPPEAVARVAACAGGIPRLINQLCDIALRLAQDVGESAVSPARVDEAAGRLDLDLPTDTARLETPLGRPRDPRAAPSPRRHPTNRADHPWRRWVAGLVVAAVGVAVLLLTIPLPRPRAPGTPAPVASSGEAPRQDPPAVAPVISSRPEPAAVVRSPVAPPATARDPRAVLSSPRATRPAVAGRPAGPTGRSDSPRARALLSGAEAGSLAEVRALLATGVAPDARDAYGMTPLMVAVVHGHAAVVRALLDRGAAVDARDDGGVTALMLAANNHRTALLQTLVAQGAAVNAKNDAGWTTLTYAAWKGHPDMVRRLLASGADPALVDRRGWTALQYATWRASSIAGASEPGSGDDDATEERESTWSASLRYAELVDLLSRATRRR